MLFLISQDSVEKTVINLAQKKRASDYVLDILCIYIIHGHTFVQYILYKGYYIICIVFIKP